MDPRRIAARDSVLVLSRAGDRILDIAAGDLVRGRVVDVRPGGSVSLRILGNLFQAKSSIPLAPNSNVLFRVVSHRSGLGEAEIRLQFLESIPDGEEAPGPLQGPPSRFLRILAQELASHEGSVETPRDMKGFLERLLRELPDASHTLPKPLREDLLNTLRTFVRRGGATVLDRMASLVKGSLPQEFRGLDPLNQVRGRLFADIEDVLHVPLREFLENTGVSLEAKLKALALLLTSQATEPSEGSPPGHEERARRLDSDLKGQLLKLKGALLAHMEELSREEPRLSGGLGKETEAGNPALSRLLHSVEVLLQDIQTFQLLSRLTDSFYTFLPFFWDGLKEGEVAFKRGRSGSHGKSYYCLLHLDFHQLGRLTVVVMLQGRDFFISFKTVEDRLRERLQKDAGELERMFQARGFSLKCLNFLGEGESQLAPFERLESLENIIDFKI
ncbi:MAG: flagellar hook-length control protein FliK [Deltaproteobacteria bacterium]|nr:flagellar hook-length control protein FliK [Deltaproteobacteria bacterium]